MTAGLQRCDGRQPAQLHHSILRKEGNEGTVSASTICEAGQCMTQAASIPQSVWPIPACPLLLPTAPSPRA